MWGLKCWKVTFVFSSIAVIKLNSFYLHLLCSWFYQIKNSSEFSMTKSQDSKDIYQESRGSEIKFYF